MTIAQQTARKMMNDGTAHELVERYLVRHGFAYNVAQARYIMQSVA